MRDRKAFSLFEMLIAVLILGALAVIAIPRITNASKSAKDRICKTNVDLMNRQIELYHLSTGSWPQQLADVTGNAAYFPDGPPECPLGWDYEIDDNYRVIDHYDHTQQAQAGDGGDGGDSQDSQGGGDGGSGGSQGGDDGGSQSGGHRRGGWRWWWGWW
jgi:prepilin-type N-terminal cleavage/methylation domain-containing protein